MIGFRLIDRLVALEPGARAAALKTFSAHDEIFGDHFPGYPIVPGTLLIEGMAQTAGWLVVATESFARAAQLVIVKDAKFRRVVRPEIEIAFSTSIVSTRGEIYELEADAHAGGQLAASARLVLQAVAVDRGEGTAAFTTWARETFRAIGGEAFGLARSTCGS
jgi:3-hydroxyacyl-[acyl-carrier-protein] dehydratase